MFSTQEKIDNKIFMDLKFTPAKVMLYLIPGLFTGALLFFIFDSEFYFYQAVLAAMVGIPVFLFFILKWTRHTLLALLVFTISFNPSLPVIRNYSTELSVGILLQASDVMVFFIFMYLLFYHIFYKNERKRYDVSVWILGLPIFFWILSGVVSIIPAVNKSIVILELARMLRIVLTFLAVYLCVESPEDIRFLALCILVSLSVQTFLVFIEYGFEQTLFRLPGETREADLAGELLRPGGTLGHSSNYAKFATFCLPVCLALIAVLRKNIWKILLGIVLLFTLVALILTLSRAGLAASLFGLSCVILLLLRSMRHRKGIVAMSLGLFVFGMAVAWFVGGNRLLNRISEDYGSAISRPQMFSVAWNVIKAHPVTGVGLNNYTLIAPDYDSTDEAISVTFPHPVHNIYMLYAAEMGIPGALSFIWFLLATIVLAFKRSFKEWLGDDSIIIKAIGIGIGCAWMQGLVDWGFRASNVHTSYLAVFAAALIALLSLQRDNIAVNQNER